MLIAQITDCHLKEKGRSHQSGFDTGADLSRAVEAINALDPEPDCVILTGDMGEERIPGEYAHLSERLAPLRPPLFLVPGNHDARAPLREAMRGQAHLGAAGPFMQFVHDWQDEHGPLRMLFLDTLDDGKTGGILCAERLNWAKARLDEARHVPTLIAMHHPPLMLGLPNFDRVGFTDPGPFQALIEAAPQVDLILCGHIHRATSGRLARARVHVGPSTSFDYRVEFRPGVPFRPPIHEPALSLHMRLGPHHWVSHAVSLLSSS